MQFQEHVSLAPFTTFRIGGPARWFAQAATESDVEEGVRFAREHQLPLFILGGGSNLLVSDAGFPGLVLHIALGGVAESVGVAEESGEDGTLFRVGAGEDWDALVARTVERGCGGVECLSGIPGTVGGTPVQNVGAYGQEVAQTIQRVRAFDRHTSTWVELDKAQCRFRYRTSLFNHEERDRFIVSRVDYHLPSESSNIPAYPDLKRYFKEEQADSPTLSDVRRAVLAIRAGKGMVIAPGDPDTQSAGSFFKNPITTEDRLAQIAAAIDGSPAEVPHYAAGMDATGVGLVKIPAAWLLEQAGFRKGYQLGRAAVSTRHTLALTNRGGATAAEIAQLRDTIQQAVEAKFGLRLEPEPVWVS
ncbi:MAG: UDP-N-acetylmuramate dehydrogenase [Acidobacteriaceae bacterium]